MRAPVNVPKSVLLKSIDDIVFGSGFDKPLICRRVPNANVVPHKLVPNIVPFVFSNPFGLSDNSNGQGEKGTGRKRLRSRNHCGNWLAGRTGWQPCWRPAIPRGTKDFVFV